MIKSQLPDWAREKKPSSKKPKPGAPTRPKLPSYANDDLKCHYRYRPYIMNLDFKVVDADADKHCVHLLAALKKHHPDSAMVRVQSTRVLTTRLFAYLLQKKKPGNGSKDGDEVKPVGDVKTLDRMLGVATTIKKTPGEHDASLSCYAETGRNAEFDEVQIDFDFYDAFLGDDAHKRCLVTPGTTECGKWTMRPDTTDLVHGPDSHFGALTAPDGSCLSDDGTGGLHLFDDPTACAIFEYAYPGRTFSPSALDQLPVTIDGLITGVVYFGKDRKRCLSRDMTIIPTLTKVCWSLRISYYNFPLQTRRLDEDDNGEAEIVGEGDVDGDGDICYADDE